MCKGMTALLFQWCISSVSSVSRVSNAKQFIARMELPPSLMAFSFFFFWRWGGLFYHSDNHHYIYAYINVEYLHNVIDFQLHTCVLCIAQYVKAVRAT